MTMSGTNGVSTEVSPDEFKSGFQATQPLIRQEWPAIDNEALNSTEGDLDKVADLIANSMQRTSTAVRKQLFELHQMATHGDTATRLSRMEAVLKRLEGRTREVAERVRADMLPKAEARVKENMWISLLVALGLGVILGMIARGSRRDG